MNRTIGRSRRGNAALVVLTLGATVGFGTLSVDLGLVWLARLELQQATDDAALSGVSELDGTEDGIARAAATAAAVVAEHTVLGSSLGATANARAIGGGETAIQVGRYATDGSFVPWADGDDPSLVNAVQVERGDQPVPAGFGAFLFGATAYEVEARSRTQRRLGAHRAASTQCFLPIAVPDCHLAGLADDTNPAPFTFTFSPSPTDSIAWADPTGHVNANDTRGFLEGACAAAPVNIGDALYVSEGAVNSALMTARDILNGTGAVDSTSWDTELYGALPGQGCVGASCRPSNSSVATANYGNVLQGPLFLVDAGDDCGAVSFTHTKVITGIAWGVIYDVRATGGGKYLKIQLDVANEHFAWGDPADDADDPTNVLVPSDPEFVSW